MDSENNLIYLREIAIQLKRIADAHETELKLWTEEKKGHDEFHKAVLRKNEF